MPSIWIDGWDGQIYLESRLLFNHSNSECESKWEMNKECVCVSSFWPFFQFLISLKTNQFFALFSFVLIHKKTLILLIAISVCRHHWLMTFMTNKNSFQWLLYFRFLFVDWLIDYNKHICHMVATLRITCCVFLYEWMK